MRHKLALVPVLALAGLLAAGIAGSDGAARAGDPPSGKDLYRDHCKICHGPDSPHGEYTPMSMIGEQWERFFDEQYVETHAGVIDSTHGGRPVLEVIGPDSLQSIRKFSIDGAADSEHPMTCG